eukprot:5298348-Pyramimonas_sp.AAC.1
MWWLWWVAPVSLLGAFEELFGALLGASWRPMGGLLELRGGFSRALGNRGFKMRARVPFGTLLAEV